MAVEAFAIPAFFPLSSLPKVPEGPFLVHAARKRCILKKLASICS